MSILASAVLYDVNVSGTNVCVCGAGSVLVESILT